MIVGAAKFPWGALAVGVVSVKRGNGDRNCLSQHGMTRLESTGVVSGTH